MGLGSRYPCLAMTDDHEANTTAEEALASIAVLNFLTYMRDEVGIDLIACANMTNADLFNMLGAWLEHERLRSP
jgi:hypothetical protein